MKALVLAGGEPQIALIRELKKRGYCVILADYSENPVARTYADSFYQKSTLDIEAIRDIVKKENVDLIITVCTDQALNTVAVLADEFNLPTYISANTALTVTNKCLMKNIFYENHIPTSKYVIGKIDNVIKESRKLVFPLVVKPADCNSSKGVTKVKNEKELIIAVQNASILSRTKEVIIEEFVQGNEVSVDAVVENGKATILAISDIYKIRNENSFVIYRAVCPANISSSIHLKIEKIVQNIADAFGLINAPLLIQLIIDGDKIHVIEFSARTGGGEKHHMLQQLIDVDIIKETVDMMLGKKTKIMPKKQNKFILNEFIYCDFGIFSHLEGFEELVKDGLIKEYHLFKIAGSKVGGAENSGDRVVGYTICNNDLIELDRINCEAVKRMKVLDINGKDIMRHDISTHLRK